MDVIQECMAMTSFGGEAKSLAMIAIRQAREGIFEDAENSLKEAQAALAKSHASHSRLLSHDAEHEDIRVSVFMMHAADHLCAAETVKALAEEMILLYKEVRNVNV